MHIISPWIVQLSRLHNHTNGSSPTHTQLYKCTQRKFGLFLHLLQSKPNGNDKYDDDNYLLSLHKIIPSIRIVVYIHDHQKVDIISPILSF